jgi:hypothetical protein
MRLLFLRPSSCMGSVVVLRWVIDLMMYPVLVTGCLRGPYRYSMSYSAVCVQTEIEDGGRENRSVERWSMLTIRQT